MVKDMEKRHGERGGRVRRGGQRETKRKRRQSRMRGRNKEKKK